MGGLGPALSREGPARPQKTWIYAILAGKITNQIEGIHEKHAQEVEKVPILDNFGHFWTPFPLISDWEWRFGLQKPTFGGPIGPPNEGF